MSEEKFDVIVVGGGPAGLSTAYFLAKRGLETLVIERGPELGAKNVFGGRIYSYFLDKYFDGWRNEAPIERWVRSERLSLLCEEDGVTIEYRRYAGEDGFDSFTAFLSKFVSWLGERVENEGASVIPGVKVEEIIFEEGMAKGVIAEGEKIVADYIVVAEGVNTLLSEKYRFRKMHTPGAVAVGIKEVIKLDKNLINERFTLSDDEGVAQFFLGHPLNTVRGGGFLYTMREYVTIGAVVKIDHARVGEVYMRDIVEDLRMHPYLRRLLEGGTIVEYSAHLVSEEGFGGLLDKPYGGGYLIVGDAAGTLLNTGFTIRGVDFAMESGRLAAETIVYAHEKGDASEDTLSYYKKLLDESIISRALHKFRNTPRFLSNERLYTVYPSIICDSLRQIYTVEEMPMRAYEALKEATKDRVSLFTLLKDLWAARGGI